MCTLCLTLYVFKTAGWFCFLINSASVSLVPTSWELCVSSFYTLLFENVLHKFNLHFTKVTMIWAYFCVTVCIQWLFKALPFIILFFNVQKFYSCLLFYMSLFQTCFRNILIFFPHSLCPFFSENFRILQWWLQS